MCEVELAEIGTRFVSMLNPMISRISQAAMAHMAGVHLTTVSRSLRDDPDGSEGPHLE